jgi:hypothetical protein
MGSLRSLKNHPAKIINESVTITKCKRCNGFGLTSQHDDWAFNPLHVLTAVARERKRNEVYKG